MKLSYLLKEAENKKYISFITFMCIFLFSFFAYSPSRMFAQSYGSGSFGGGNYNTGTGDTVNSGGSGGSSSSGPAMCTAQTPISSPYLYEIDVKGTNVTLYLAPPPMPYTNYQISFGDGTKDEGYNVTFPMSNATGAIAYTIHALQPNSVYSFKVRALNSCAPGSWSGDMTARSGTLQGTYISKSYPSTAPVINYVPNTTVTQQSSGTYQKGNPQTFVPKPQVSNPITRSSNNSNTTKQRNNSGGIWGTITNFFSHLF